MNKNYPLEEKMKKLDLIGLGPTAFSRLGPEISLSNYQILSLLESGEDKCINKKVKTKHLFSFDHKRQGKSSTFEILQAEKGRKYLRSIKNLILYLYRINTKNEKYLDGNEIKYIASKSNNFLNLSNKIEFYKLLEKLKIALPSYEVVKIKNIDYQFLKNKYKKFVIQAPKKGGGRGTFFIANKEDFDHFKKKVGFRISDFACLPAPKAAADSGQGFRISQYINGPSPSMTLCMTSSGPIIAPLQYQIISPKECIHPKQGKGFFTGHDWTSSNFSKNLQNQANEIGQKIGKHLKEKYFGILGIDFVLDEKKKKLYPVECNPRLTGSFPVYSFVQEINHEPQIIYYHILASLYPKEKVDVKKINKMISGSKQGSQLLIYNREDQDLVLKNDIKCGVYMVGNDQLEYKRCGYRLTDLKNNDEIIITDGILFKDKVFRPGRKICRILAKKPILADNKKELNGWAKDTIRRTYQLIE